jgi:hypothetical protein
MVVLGRRFDADAQAYIRRVEVADGAPLEESVKQAINNFVIGCKADGIWDAIKASCILAGARTLAGALVPLVGTAPTNFNFVSGDYNRKTGLMGDGTTKYLDSNRNNNADPQDSQHLSAYVTTAHIAATNSTYIGVGVGAAGLSHVGVAKASGLDLLFFRSRTTTANDSNAAGSTVNFLGVSRSSSQSFDCRFASTTTNVAIVSETSFNGNLLVFGRTTTSAFVNGRIAFYSIGESLNLALLDARVTTLINAYNVAIA